MNDDPIQFIGRLGDPLGIWDAIGMLSEGVLNFDISIFRGKSSNAISKSVGVRSTIKQKSVKGYTYKKNIGGKFNVYEKTVKASNLSGQASAKYYKVFNSNGNMIKMYKDSYLIDGSFYHRRNIYPEFKNIPRYSK